MVSNKEEYVRELEKKVDNVEKKYSQLTSRVSATSKETAEEVIELKTGNQELLKNLQEKDKNFLELNCVISQLKEDDVSSASWEFVELQAVSSLLRHLRVQNQRPIRRFQPRAKVLRSMNLTLGC